MFTRRSLLLAATCTAVIAGRARADTSSNAFVTAIYAAYKGKDANGVRLDTEATIRRYFEPTLAALIIKDQKTSKARNEVGSLDFDPFVDAQDWDIASFDIQVTDAPPDKATATVKFSNSGNASTVTLALVKIKKDWKISDITWEPHEGTKTLRGLLAH